ncbi:MAG: arsenic transporter [Clostridiales bacterium]|nr:arsenic transporter [Clostridiales bacterium]
MILALILFVVTYILLLALPNHRHWVALGSAAVFLALRILPGSEILAALDFNVLLMIAGTMGLVSLFIESGMPALLADCLIARMPNVKWVAVALSLFAGFISAFVDNVATVLMIAPVAMAIAKRLELDPVPLVIAIAVSSNLQGAATLVGDTTSILLGGYADMDFLDFFVFHGKPGMFWVVEVGAVLTVLVLLALFRNDTQRVEQQGKTVVRDYVPTVLLCLMLVLLIGASFLPKKPAIINGLICTVLFVAGLMIELVRTKDTSRIALHLKSIDYQTILLLFGLFLVIGGITQAGVVDAISRLFLLAASDNLFVIYTLIVWASVLFSAFIDNIPYTATMLPVVQGISAALGVEPYLLYFGLLAGATLGGNLTPVGASANITAIGILRREGCTVRTKDFMRIGVPFSLVAVLSGYLLIWVIWH